jgi:glutaconate CoA-transferase, subunit A
MRSSPRGAHPFSSPGHYLVDEAHLGEYLEAAAQAVGTERDRTMFEAYLDRYVTGPADHIAYLETVGVRQLLSLAEWE